MAFLRSIPVNLYFRKVGGIRFLKLGRLTISFSIARDFRHGIGKC